MRADALVTEQAAAQAIFRKSLGISSTVSALSDFLTVIVSDSDANKAAFANGSAGNARD